MDNIMRWSDSDRLHNLVRVYQPIIIRAIRFRCPKEKISIVFCLVPDFQVDCPFKPYPGEYHKAGDTPELKPQKKRHVAPDDLDK